MNSQPSLEAAPIKSSTQTGYMKAVMAAHRHTQAKRTIDWEEPPIITMTQVVEDLIARQDLTRETKLVARSALMWFIKSGQIAQDQDSRDAIAMLESLSIPRGPKPKMNRPKTINEQELGQLLDELYTRAEKSVWAFRSTVWIQAGLACGARPVEWLDAAWSETDPKILRIKNAKIKLLAPAFSRNKPLLEDDPEAENLGYWEPDEQDPYRCVPIGRESDHSMIETQLQYIREAAPLEMSEEARRNEFKKYHDACALAIRRACRKIWGSKKTYSLYTMRSQFSANIKASMAADAAAKLMGHSSADSPSAAYYGKWNQAHTRFKGGQAARNNQKQAPIQHEATPSQAPIE